jgi:hypothetical protein
MTATLNTTSRSLLKSLGYKDVNAFVIAQSKRIFEEKILNAKDKVLKYEQKYGMTYQEFIERVIDKNDPILSKFGIIEKEDDDFDWEYAIDMLEVYQQKIQDL